MMAYDKKKIMKTALEKIKKHNLFFIEDVVAYIPISKTTFYEYYPNESDDYKKIVEALDENRVSTKVKMRKKWNDSENPTLQIGLMKLIANDQEAHRLNGTKTEVKVEGKVSISPKEWV